MHAYCINNFQQCKMHSYEETPMCPNFFYTCECNHIYTHTIFLTKKDCMCNSVACLFKLIHISHYSSTLN